MSDRAVLLRRVTVPVRCAFRNEPPELDPEAAGAIDGHWSARVEKTPRLVRGSVLWLRRLDFGANAIELDFGVSDYAHYLYTMDHPRSTVRPCRVAYTSALVVTSDGHAVFGEMAHWTSNPRQLQCAGGGLSLADVAGDVVDIRRNIVNEVREELNLFASTPGLGDALQRPFYIKTGGDRDMVGLIHLAQLAMALPDVCRCHDRIPPAEREFAQLVAVRLTAAEVRAWAESDDRPKVDYLVPLLEQVADVVSGEASRTAP